ncbi:hypothetical protein [Dictyobacter aurantiacus]|uniref:Saccharopine dehydrogenase NADP binding domain-containing protein n=1 Tax=Dictyobacter aurantiacus TaxID=1936993 RepID=A0A401ZQQ3_9CHLR|nr:hypothetical protein [Dictyobacter aurantiacus]GCE09140.1 hypothetical protein KDAU_64690 [Dictyobacter aurantiacus]
MASQRILFIGLGDLGSHMFDLLVRTRGHHSFLVGGRNLDYLQQRTNLSLLSAVQLGYEPGVACTYLDLEHREQTAETIAAFQPDIIVCAATLQKKDVFQDLPDSVSKRLLSAQLGPRLPWHLALMYTLMQSVSMSGQRVQVLNAIYPDVVNPILAKVGLAPTTGVGDLANNVPALRQVVSGLLNVPREQVDVRLIMSRYVSYWMSRIPLKDVPFSLSIAINGVNKTDTIDQAAVFQQLRSTLRRIGGSIGNIMTAASAAVIFDGIVNDTGIITHAPGPNGLPGGYPVYVDGCGVNVILPEKMSLQAAIDINEAGLMLDGIEHIDEDGTVVFAEREMSIFREVLGYDCRRMPLCEVDDWAKELQVKYQKLALHSQK